MAEPMLADVTARCQRLGLTVFDPQTGTLTNPPAGASPNAGQERRRLFKRRNGVAAHLRRSATRRSDVRRADAAKLAICRARLVLIWDASER